MTVNEHAGVSLHISIDYLSEISIVKTVKQLLQSATLASQLQQLLLS